MQIEASKTHVQAQMQEIEAPKLALNSSKDIHSNLYFEVDPICHQITSSTAPTPPPPFSVLCPGSPSPMQGRPEDSAPASSRQPHPYSPTPTIAPALRARNTRSTKTALRRSSSVWSILASPTPAAGQSRRIVHRRILEARSRLLPLSEVELDTTRRDRRSRRRSGRRGACG
jgi:hypothetical protein